MGYKYQACENPVVKNMITTIEGFDPSIRTLTGPWTFDIHHTYFPDKATVYFGYGRKMELDHRSLIITTVMGDGAPRSELCENCNGIATVIF